MKKNCALFCSDDAQFLDPASWQLLQQLWEKGSGFALMLAFSGKVDNHESHPLTKSLTKKNHEEMFGSCDRLCRKELPHLTFEAIKELVQHIFHEAGFVIDDETLYDKIQDISGGNPLYIYELSKAMIDKFLATRGIDEVKDSVADSSVAHPHHSVLTKSDVGKLLKDFHNARVEEVIYYRFDQLPALSQTLLKLASVACASGSSGFNLPMLLMMLSKEDNEDVATDVFMADMQLDNNLTMQQTLASELRKILMKDEFLRIDANSRRSSMSDSQKDELATDIASALQTLVITNLDDDMLYNDLEQHTFQFKIVLERQTIYDLMLEDQRESLHDRVAAYLERENQEKADFLTLSAHDLYEEGFHWEKATIWSSAMSCYYRSAMMLDGLGAYQESFQRLTSAYRMFNALRKDAGLAEDLQRPYDMDSLVAFIQKSVQVDVVDRESVQTAFGMSVKDVFKIFGGDAASLQTGINVCLRLAQASFTLSDNYNIVSKLYEDALIMIMLTWRDPASTDPIGEHELVLQDQQVVFPILAGISTMFRTNRLQDDETHSKEAALYEMIMLFAQDSNDFALHHLQGMCLLHSLCSERLDHEKCGELARQIKQVYKLEEHSAQLVKWYGNDRVAFTLAKNIMLQKLRGCVVASNQDILELLEMTPKISHLHSLAILALPLSSVLVALRREMEGERVFTQYYDLEQSRDGYSFFRDSNPVFIEFFRVYGCFLSGTFCPHDDLTPIQQKILHKDFLPAKRSLLFDAVSSMAVSVESLCGMILEMLAGMWLKHAGSVESPLEKFSLFTQAMLALEVAADYAEIAVKVSSGANRLVFSHSLALINKAGIAHTTALVKSKVIPDEQAAISEATKYHAVARDSLHACAQLGLKFHFPYVLLLAAQDMQECGYDLEQSSEWQEEGIKLIVAGNDQNKKQEVYDEIVRIFPTTRRFKHLYDLEE
ncbi:hypothetical protein EON64_00585 [archaeon]|nr:MAG: hypothetical protein EON64_00585 [archaeon]